MKGDSPMRRLALRLLRQQEGQTLIEYMLVVSMLAIATIGIVTFLGGRVKNSYYENFTNTLP